MQNVNNVLGLAAIRRSRGISLQQISQSTKISTRSLQAIEDSDFKKLPGGIYNTSYIRQYARAIQYDEAELLAYYYERTGAVLEPPPEKQTGSQLFRNFGPASTIAGS